MPVNDDVLGAPSVPVEDDDNPTPIQDETLAGEPDVVDVTGGVEPEDFDFDAFVSGVRPGRRQVKVYMRADLAAELDRILHRAEELPKDMDPEEREQVEAELLDELEGVKAQIEASARKFVVEARSDHRARQIMKTMEKEGFPRPGKKTPEDEVYAWNNELALRRLADAIVVPSNVTVDGLRKMDEVAQSEIQKLYGALADVNSNPTKAVTPNFSLRR